MIRVNNSKVIVSGSVTYAEYAGLSTTDTKPEKFGTKVFIVNGERQIRDIALATGSLFLEVDTGDVYAWDETGSTWHKIASLGGDS